MESLYSPRSLLSQYHSAAPELHRDDLRTEREFRIACARRCGDPAYAGLPTIQRIAAVGALGFRFGGPSQDDRILTSFLTKTFRAGLRISPDFEIDSINFREGRDFLAERWTYDAAVICFIVGFTATAIHNQPLRVYDAAQADGQYGFVISRTHTRFHWQDRLRTCGAGLIMTYGSVAEIGTSDLEEPHLFRTLLPTTTSASMFNHGYLARPDLIEAYRIHPGAPLDADTLLGRALLAKPNFGAGLARLDAVFNLRA